MILNLLHIILALAVSLSSSGVLINQHFCGEELKHVAFYVKAQECDHANQVCSKKKEESKSHACCSKGKKCDKSTFVKVKSTDCKKGDCCNNKSKFNQEKYEFQPVLSDNLQLGWHYYELQNCLSTESTQRNFDQILALNILKSKYYRPPPLQEDIIVLMQAFLC
ncbi:MAG: hypothetical protein GY810_30980 [Aureispira sp.]|nr:hypothetical protein [Aureispira sp.]